MPRSRRGAGDLRVPWRVVGVMLLVTALSYLNCLGCGFVFDDVSAIKENKDLRPSSPVTHVFLHDFWGTPMSKEQSHKSYRPLTVLTFRLNYLLHALQPLGYHLGNVALHFLVCVLYYKLCLVFVPRSVAQIASLLFAVHPVHTEAVTGVVGRAELISSIFFIMAIVSYRKAALSSALAPLALFSVYSALAVFSKEQGITVIGVCAAYEVLVVQGVSGDTVLTLLFSSRHHHHHGKSENNHHEGKKSREGEKEPILCCGPVLRIGVATATAVTLLFLRFKVMGSTLPVFTNFDNPASYEAAPAKQLTWSYLVTVNAALLLSPSELCCDWTMGTIPLVKSLADPRNLATIFTFAVLLNLGLAALFGRNRRHRTALIGCLTLLSLPFLPASNLFFPVGFVVAERVLYLPSMGSCLLVAYGFTLIQRQLSSPKKKLLKAALAALLAVHVAKTVARNMDWRDELSIFKAGLKVNSGNAKLFNNVGHALESESRFGEALSYFRRAVRVQPDDVGAHINVGRTLVNLEMPEEAEAAYLEAKALLPQARPGKRYTARVAPQHLSVFLNLANLISKDPSRLEEADSLYQQAISMRSDYVQAYINRGDVLLKLNRSDEAQEVYERALAFDEQNPDLYYNLGVVHIERGVPDQALYYFDKALELDPDHVQALMNSAILMQETGRPEFRPTAYDRLFKVKDRLPDNDRVYFNLGMLGMDDGDYDSAEGWFKRAVQLKPDFRSALFNLALLLNEQKRPVEAVPFLESLLGHFPDHVKGLILLGDINTNHVRDYASAERCYRRIIEIDPGHVQARHNLCVVAVERGRLDEAEECLLEVRRMAPELEYVERHLEIVRKRIKLVREGGDRSDDQGKGRK